MTKASLTVAACATLLWTGAALAIPTPQQKCEAGKNLAAGTYAACLQRAEKNLVLNGNATKYATAIARCDAALLAKWGRLEAAAVAKGTTCPSTGDAAVVEAFVTANAGTLATALHTPPLTSCNYAPAQPLQTGQTTAYGTGSDGAVQAGVVRQYVDNGDGTITDNKTGVMWEKKDQSGGIHDWGNSYTWSGASYGSTNIMDGTITTTFLAALNAGGGFAGHTDWRIPNRFELESILNLQNVNPAVGTAFNTSCAASCTVLTCSCTQSNYYWSSTTYQNVPGYAWYVYYYDGYVNGTNKHNYYYVRAVRGGS
jgi:hypothetical protein